METIQFDVNTRIEGEFKSQFLKLQMEFQRQNFVLRKTQVQLAQEQANNSLNIPQEQDLFSLAETNAQLLAQVDKDKLEIQRLNGTNVSLIKDLNQMSLEKEESLKDLKEKLHDAQILIAERNQEIRNLNKIPKDEKCLNCSISLQIQQESLKMAQRVVELEQNVQSLLEKQEENDVMNCENNKVDHKKQI